MGKNKQTAVQWLKDQLPIRIQNSHRTEIEKAKSMEKQQIIDAYEKGAEESWDAQQYYNETYGKQEIEKL